MSYQVLARRLRPQTFEEIIGQDHVTRTLRGAIESGRVAHAFLFAGPRGVGKTTTARLLAKALTCEKGPTTQPCNACSNCREITEGTAIDVLELDGASNRGIDDAREIIENVRYRPAKSRLKLYIIDEVHQLTKEAFNALLKTLEEPPAHVKFIFATTEPDKVLPTILSRCQRYDFRRLSAVEIRDHLQQIIAAEQITMSPEGLFLIAREADGSVRDAQSLLEQVTAFVGREVSDQDLRDVLGLADRTVLYDVADAIIDREPARCLTLIEQLYRYGYDVRRFCRDLLEHMRNLMVAKLFGDEQLLADVPPGETDRIRAQAARRSPEEVQRLFRILLQGDEDIGRSLHPKLVLEMTLVRLATQEPLVPIAEITAKLEALEAKLDETPGAGRSNTPGGGSRQATSPGPRTSSPPRSRPGGGRRGKTAQGLGTSEMPATGTPVGGEGPAGTGVNEQDQENPIGNGPAAQVPGRATGDPDQAVPWSDFLSLVQGEKKTLYMTLATSRCMNIGPETLTIGVESDVYARELARHETRHIVEELAQRFFGRQLSVRIESVPVGAVGVGAGQAASPLQQEEQLKRDAEKHPAVQDALRVLGGEIRAVRQARRRSP